MKRPIFAAFVSLLSVAPARAVSLATCPDLGVTLPADAVLAGVGDLDGDGLPDIVLRSDADGTLHVLFSSAPGVLTPLPLPLYLRRVDAHVLDVNADGVLDVAMVEPNIPSGWGTTTGVSVAFGPLSSTAPQWTPTITTVVGSGMYGRNTFGTLPDLDNDGAEELVVGISGEFVQRRVLLSGGLMTGLYRGFGVGWSSWSANDMTGMFDAGDVDSDGLRELVATGEFGTFLFRGSDVAASAASGAALYTDVAGVELSDTGNAVRRAAAATDFDANADGYDDLLLLTSNRVYLVNGRASWPRNGGVLAASNRWSGRSAALTSLSLVRGTRGRSTMAVFEPGAGVLVVALPAGGPARIRSVPATSVVLPDGTREATTAPLARADIDGDGVWEWLFFTDDAGTQGLCWMG